MSGRLDRKSLETLVRKGEIDTVLTVFPDGLSRLMGKRPDDRPASMEEVRQELLPWTGGEPVLPLDDQADAEYQQAVAEAKNAENAEELFAEDIVSASRMSDLREAPAPARPWPWSQPLLGFYVVIVGVLAIMLLAGLLYLLLR